MFHRTNSKKGFTLIELMAVIIIVGILSILSIGAITRFIAKSRQQKVVQNKKNIVMAAEMYLQSNRDLMPKMIGDHASVKMLDLRNANYLKEDVSNEKGEDCMKESFVYVFKLSDSDYSYTPHLYCGDEKAPAEYVPASPYLVDHSVTNDGETKKVKVLFSGSNDVKKANFSFVLKGDQSGELGIYSYSYSILAKIGGESTFTEVYNSGTLEANLVPSVEFQSRPISSYLDLSGTTNIEVRVTALNEEGGFLSYETQGLAAFGGSSYVDTVNPLCPALDDYAGRIGEPRDFDDWINKSDIGTNRYPRLITLRCDDGDGSGCKRDTFSQSWPDTSEEYKFGVMFGKIVMEDNAVTDENGNRKDANSIVCPINVFVDVKSPSIEITPRNPKNNSLAGDGPLFSTNEGKLVLEDGPEPVADPLEKTITAKDYKKIFLGFDIDPEDAQKYGIAEDDLDSAGWMNKENYPDGIEYEVMISDNIYLTGYTWEVNAPYQGVETANYETLYSDQYEGSSWWRNEHDETKVDEDAVLESKTPLDPVTNQYVFKIAFKEEGARYGVLTVYDRAGNASKVYIYANLDRTPPPLDYPAQDDLETKFYKVPNPHVNAGVSPSAIQKRMSIRGDGACENDNPDKYTPLVSNNVFSLDAQKPQYNMNELLVPPQNVTQEMYDNACADYIPADQADSADPWFQGYNVCCEPDFKEDAITSCYFFNVNGSGMPLKPCESNLPLNGKGTVYGIKKGQALENLTKGTDKSTLFKNMDGSYQDHEVQDEYNTPTTSQSTEEDLLNARRVGCYKIGSLEGNNGIEPKDPNDPNLEEYQAGTWSNESLICGPLDNMAKDNFVTSDEGNEVEIDNEISGWFAVEVNVYKQDGQQIIPKYSYYSNDSNRPTEFSTIPTYNYTDPEHFDSHLIYVNDRSSWITLKEQGTHKLVWTTCDKAGNCYDDSDEDLIEEKGNNTVIVKIDTVNPLCQNSIKYTKYVNRKGAVKIGTTYNSESGIGPNSNGWLYDKQVATVFHSCVDVGDANITEYDDGWDNSDTYGSGCAGGMDSSTNDYFDYAFDVFTSAAGTDGVGKFGYVEDIAGNKGECKNGVNVWKDSVSPQCYLNEIWTGENFLKENGGHNVPSKHFWAVEGMNYRAQWGGCRDNVYAKLSVYNQQPAYSTCYNQSDLTDKVVRKSSLYEGTFGYYDYDKFMDDNMLREIDDEYEIDMGDGYYYDFQPSITVPRPDIQYVDISEPFYGQVGLMGIRAQLRHRLHRNMDDSGAVSYSFKWEEKRAPYNGFTVDEAGNISYDACESIESGLDTKTPTCNSQVEIQNRAYGDEEYINSRGDSWAGSTGADGTPEYSLVFRGCIDAHEDNYLYYNVDKYFYSEDASSGCDKKDQINKIFWIYGNPAVVPEGAEGRITYGEYYGEASFNGPYAMPQSNDYVIDMAGYKGYGSCGRTHVAIDYTAPTCKASYIYKDGKNFSAEYKGNLTNQIIYSKGECDSDNGAIQSGCDAAGDYKYYADDLFANPFFEYKGKNSEKTSKIMCTDVAGNYAFVTDTQLIKQDTVHPTVKCEYSGYYKKDGSSEVKVKINSIADPPGNPDNFASGIDYSKSYISFSGGLSKQTLKSGQMEYIIKPTCASSESSIKAYITVFDKADNSIKNVACTGTPIVVPGCCTKMTNTPDKCSDYKTSSCTKKCGGGTQYEYRDCTNTSYYNGATCKFKDVDDGSVRACNTQACCSQTTDSCNKCKNTYEDDNPCSYGFQKCNVVSKYDSSIICGSRFTRICKVDQAACEKGMDPIPGQPSSNTCDVYLYGNTASDVVEVRPTDFNCDFKNVQSGSVDNPVEGCFARRTSGGDVLKVTVTPFATPGENLYKNLCLFNVTWMSNRYNFDDSIYRHYSFGVVQCKREDGTFHYCLNSCDNVDSCVPKLYESNPTE